MLLLFLLASTYSIVINYNRQFYSNSFSDVDFTTWTIAGAFAPTINLATFCNSQKLFGGYGLFTGDEGTAPTSISRTFSGLPPHWSVRVRAKVYKIDSWNNQRLSLLLDGKPADSFSWSASFGGGDVCGTLNPILDATNSAYNDGYVLVDANISHSASNLVVRFETDLTTKGGAYWGLRQFSIQLDLCDPTCGTCNAATGCLTCPTISNIDPPINLGNGLVNCECASGSLAQLDMRCTTPICMGCLSVCDPGYYVSGSSCIQCSISCSTCTGPLTTATQCLTCSQQYFRDTTTDPANVCQSCHSSCKTCINNSSSSCLSCVSGFLLTNSQCLSTCPMRTFGSQSINQCLACATNCLTCFGSAATQCLTCDTGYFLSSYQCTAACPSSYFIYGTTCYTDCPLGTFSVSGTQNCQGCSANCINCSDSQCFICQVGYAILNGLCYNPCPTSTFLIAANKTCVNCDSNCLECSGAQPNQCTACFPGLNLQLDGTCSDECPLTTFYNDSLGICDSCYPICLTCSDSLANSCSSCMTGYYLHINLTQCVASCDLMLLAVSEQVDTCWTCPTSFYPSGDRCVICDVSCLQCTAESFDGCTQCPSDRNLQYGMCVCAEGTEFIGSCQLGDFTQQMHSPITCLLLANIGLCIFLQIILKQQTNIIVCLEAIQIVSLIYYIQINLPYSILDLAFHLLLSHIYILAPPIGNITRVGINGRIVKRGLTSYFSMDFQGAFFVYLTLGLTKLILITMEVVISKKNLSLWNAMKWVSNKASEVSALWFRLTIMHLMFALGINVLFFSWSDLKDIISLVCFLLPVVLAFVTFFYRKHGSASRQFAMCFSQQYDYGKNSQEGDIVSEREKSDREKSNSTQQNIYEIQETGDSSRQGSNSSYSQRVCDKAHEDTEPNMMSANTEYDIAKRTKTFEQKRQPLRQNTKSPYYSPILFIFLKAVIGFVLGILRNHSSTQIVIYCFCCAVLFVGALNMNFKRKFYRLNAIIAVSITLANSLLLSVYQLTGVRQMVVGMMLTWLLGMFAMFVISVIQLLVNSQNLIKIMRSFPPRIHRILSKLPEN